jgi:hypothetical protein
LLEFLDEIDASKQQQHGGKPTSDIPQLDDIDDFDT